MAQSNKIFQIVIKNIIDLCNQESFDFIVIKSLLEAVWTVQLSADQCLAKSDSRWTLTGTFCWRPFPLKLQLRMKIRESKTESWVIKSSGTSDCYQRDVESDGPWRLPEIVSVRAGARYRHHHSEPAFLWLFPSHQLLIWVHQELLK